MKKIFKTNLAKLVTLLVVLNLASCTKLDTKIKDPNSIQPSVAGTAPAPSSLSKLYEGLNNLVNGQGKWFAMQEQSSDELQGPTRGTDWDDFGKWRQLHLHTWGGVHEEISGNWNDVNQGLFQTTLLAEATGKPANEVAAAKFLRAYWSYIACDLFGYVQHRPATAKADEIPAVFTRAQATDFIISELESLISTNALPAYSAVNRTKASKEAAEFLLAKTYLNKAVFKQDPANADGFTATSFTPADMNKVIALCNDIKANPALQLNSYFWDSFTWTNRTTSTENIFAQGNDEGNNLVWLTCMGNHYNMVPDGWNGMTTLADFYNSYDDPNDLRKNDTIRGTINYTAADADPSIYWDVASKSTSYIRLVGRPAGFIIGQVRGPNKKHTGNAIVNLKDRSGNALIMTPDCPLVAASEVRGIRNNKYPIDPKELNGGGWGSKNDFPFFRFADVRLMKAEAILRGGSDAETPLAIVNELRGKRNAAPRASVDLTELLAERGRELYLEGWRRNDLIRFHKFRAPNATKLTITDQSRLVYAIPTFALSSNPNLKQNVGY